MKCIKRQLVIEFRDYNIATMIYALEIIVEMVVPIIANELNSLLKKNSSLREKIPYVISSELFVDTTNEHVIEH